MDSDSPVTNTYAMNKITARRCRDLFSEVMNKPNISVSCNKITWKLSVTPENEDPCNVDKVDHSTQNLKLDFLQSNPGHTLTQLPTPSKTKSKVENVSQARVDNC